ncbi:MAG: GntR family transcriptional regulator [Ruminococcus sp.]|nr:GntR family transcriptional regulator [Candidatus Apopatosoma intestinale]
MITIDIRSRTPIYEQLVAAISSLVLTGAMKPDEPVPSVRALAGELSVNPNTVQKAFTELERRGVLYSVPGKGRFVSGEVGRLREEEKEEARKALRQAIRKGLASGLTPEEIAAIAAETGGKNDD